ncbi:MAG: DUF5989 family protein [Myxococcota bacterium]
MKDELTRRENLAQRVHTVRELYQYISEKRLWGMVFLVTVLMLLSVVFVVVQSAKFLAPFVYTIF